MRKGEPTPDEMFKAVEGLGEVLRRPGDNKTAIRHRIAKETGLSERCIRAYFHREARVNHLSHLTLIEAKTREIGHKAGASSNEIQELRDRLERLERLLDEERSRDPRASSSEDWSSLGKLGRIHSPVA